MSAFCAWGSGGATVQFSTASESVNASTGSFSVTVNLTGTPVGTVSVPTGFSSFNGPDAGVFDSSGNAYVAGATSITKVTPAGSASTFPAGYNSFNIAYGMVFDSAGNLYVADYLNNVVKKITPGGTVSQYPNGSTTFDGPSALAIDSSGNLYVAISGSVQTGKTVMKVTPGGAVSNYPAGFSSFDDPGALAFDSAGNLYVADQGTFQIKKVTPGGTVSQYPNTTTFFNDPSGLAVDSAGNLYVANGGNMAGSGVSATIGAVIQVTPAGAVSLFPAGYAGFSTPLNITLDATGNLWVPNYTANNVSKVSTLVSVPFSLGGTAANNVDYSSVTVSPLVFQLGVSSLTISGNLISNVGANKTLTFTLGTPTGAAASLGSTTVNTLTIVQPSPVPTLSSISPNSGVVGSGNTTITLTGTGFVPTSTVNFNGAAVSTTYVSATSLTAVIPSADLTSPGTQPITVVNPAPGGGTSTAKNFIIISLPVANADGPAFYATQVNRQFGHNAPGVLGNDTLNGASISSYGASTGLEQTSIGSATATAQGGSIVLNADGSFTFTPKGGYSGADTFKYTLTNGGGSSTATVNLYVDTLPTVTSATPANNATSVSINTPITINFSEQIDTTTAFQISPAVAFNQTPADGNATATFTLTPTAPLAAGQQYTVTAIGNQTADVDGGLSMASNYVFSFTTLPLPVPMNDPDTQGNRYQVTAGVTYDSASTPSSIFDNDTLNGATVTYGATGPTAFTPVDGSTTITTPHGATVLLRVNGTFTYTPAPGYTGPDNFFYKLTNGSVIPANGTPQAQVLFTVNANNAPTLNAVSNPAAIPVNSPLQSVSLSGITDGTGDTGQTLTVSAASNNQTLIPNGNISKTYTSPNTTGTVSYTPAANQFGTAVITVTVQDNGGTANGGVDTVTQTFTVIVNPPTPSVTSISPTAGPSTGGTFVTITGTNFTGATAVTIGGAAATGITIVSPTSITATTPAGSAGTASVLVTTNNGTNVANSLYTYVTPPTVTVISPSSGSTLGGTQVTITGTNFTGATSVTIGGAAATGITVVSPTSITATTPAGSAGTASVLVTTAGGPNAANTLYTYVPPPTVTAISPTSGPTTGGTLVTITGTNFSGATAVTIGGAAATGVTVVSPTSITATAPAGSAGTASVLVTTAGGTNVANSLYAYQSSPVMTPSFGAGSIAVGGSTSLTFTIQNPNASSLSGVGFSATLPAGLVVATPSGQTGSSGGGTFTATAGSGSVSLSGAAIGAASSLIVSINVTGTAAGAKSFSTGTVSSTEGGTGTAGTASLNVFAAPTISISFGAPGIPLNSTTTLTFTVTNPAANPAPLTSISFTDTLPAGLVVATPNGLTGSLGGGTITATAGSGSVSLSGATLAAGGSGNFSVNVTGTSAGAKTNLVQVVSSNGGSGNTASASLTVNPLVDHFTFTSTPSNATAGVAFSTTITAFDNNNTLVVGYTGTVHFTSSDPAVTKVLPVNYTFVPGDNSSHTFASGVTLVTAGTQSLSVADTVLTSATGTTSVNVSPATATHYALSAPGSIAAGTAFNCTVTALDQFGNTATVYGGTVHFTSTDGTAILPADSTLTNGTGTFSATLKTAGSRTLTATDTVAPSISGTSGSIAVTAGASTHFTVTAPGSATAGAAFTVTVTAQDQFGNTAPGYAGTTHFTSTDGQAVLPANTSLTAGAGSFSATLKTSGTQSITATDTVTGSITGTSGSIAVSPAAASQLAITSQPSATATAGVVFGTQPVVKEEDSFGNVITSDSTHTITVARGTHGGATLQGGPLTLSLVNGVATFSGLSYNVAETLNLGFTTTAGAFTATSSDIVVSPAAASQLVVTSQPSATATAGVVFGTQPVVKEEDSLGNVITSDSTSTVTVARGTHGSAALQGAALTLTLSNGVATFSGLSYNVAETMNLGFSTSAGAFTATSNDIVVNPSIASQLVITSQPSATATAGVVFATQPVVKEEDSFGNVITSDSTHTITVARGNHGGAALQGAALTLTLANGVATFSGLSYNVAETMNLVFTTTAGVFTVTSNDIVVGPAAATKFVVSAPGSIAAGTAFNYTVTAEDAFGNTATGYAGTAHFTSSDAAATLPANSSLAGGTGTFSATLDTSGSRTITATDTVTPSITGTSAGIAVAPDPAIHFIVSIPGTAAANTPVTTTLTAVDQFNNVATAYRGTAHFTSSDTSAALPADYSFVAGDNGVHTFTNGVTFQSTGSQTVTATDTVTSSITGSTSPVPVSDVVSITSTTPTAIAGGPTGAFQFTRAGHGAALTVNFTLDGASTAATTSFALSGGGSSFNGSTGTVSIPASATSVTLTFTALANTTGIARPDQTAQLDVASGTGYTVGSPATATVTITKNGFKVFNTSDSGEGSLRQAVLNGNALGGSPVITFAPGVTGTLLLTSGEIDLTSPMTLAGPGAKVLAIDGNEASRVFSIAANATLSGLTIQHGRPTGSIGGGGILISSGTVSILACTITGNDATASSSPQGGGINNSGGILTIAQSAIADNNAHNAGGIYLAAATVITNSTITGNTAAGSGGGSGGGIIFGASLTLTNCTVFGNSATSGGNLQGFGPAACSFGNTLIAGGTGAPPDLEGGSPNSFNSLDYNLIGDATGATFTGTTTHNLTGTDAAPLNPLLGPLQDNGGPTPTMAITPASPAFNAGSNALAPVDTFDLNANSNTSEAVPYDQRGEGFNRIVATIDIGAFEIQDQAPVIRSVATSVLENASGVTLDATLFEGGFTDPDVGDSLHAVMVVSLPTHGSLALGGIPVTASQVIPLASLGSLVYTPAINYNGPDSFLWNGSDGTRFAASSASVNITVTPVNQPPSFTKGGDVTVPEAYPAAAPFTQTGWATGLSAGPPNESSQTLQFNIIGNSNAALFSVAPAIDSSGTLTFTINPLVFTTPASASSDPAATISVRLQDSGGTANGGVDTSSVQTFQVNITHVNHPPMPVGGGVPAQLVTIGAGSINVDLSSYFLDVDLDDTLSYSLVSNSDNTHSTDVLTGHNLQITPVGTVTGSSQVTIRVTDNGTTNGSSTPLSITDTFTVTTGTSAPTLAISSKIAINRQTGLLEEQITITNTMGRTIDGFRFTVTNLPAAYKLEDATGATATTPAKPYLDYTSPIAANATVTITLSFYSPTRSFGSYVPVYTVVELPPQKTPAGSGLGVSPDQVVVLPDDSVLVEFVATIGHSYQVQYSNDGGTTWLVSPIGIKAGATRVQWIDRGQPYTNSAPAIPVTREYLVNDVTP